jgi:transposase
VPMSSNSYTDEFRIAAVKQLTEGGHSVGKVARQLDLTTKILCEWKEKYGESETAYQEKKAEQGEVKRLKPELKRVTQERDILKAAAVFFAGEPKNSARS